MTSLPSGLASISARMDDAPNVRGAVAFGRMVREREETQAHYNRAASRQVSALGGRWPTWDEAAEEYGEPEQDPFDRHAALVISSAYRSADRR